MAVVTTFITTPLTTALYPTWYQVKVERWRRGEIDWDGNALERDSRSDSITTVKNQLKTMPVRKLLVYLRLDGLSGICTLAALLSPNRAAALTSPQVHPAKAPKQTDQGMEEAVSADDHNETALRVHGVRLLELTDRDSSVMRVSAREQGMRDPVVNTFQAFGEWHDVSLMADVSVVPEYSYADTIINMARLETSDLLLLPWSETGTLADCQNGLEIDTANRFSNGAFTDFIYNILQRVQGNVGIFVEHNPKSSHPPTSNNRSPARTATSGSSIQSIWARNTSGARSHHIIFPFFGSADDHFALRFVLQLARNDQVTATIIQMSGNLHSTSTSSARDRQPDIVFFETLRDSVPESLQDRVVFQPCEVKEAISDPCELALAAVRRELSNTPNKPGCIVVVGRNSGLNQMSTGPSLDNSVGPDTYQVLGAVAATMIEPENGVFGSTFVLQAGMENPSADGYR